MKMANDGLHALVSFVVVQQRLTIVFGQSAVGKELEKIVGWGVPTCLKLHQRADVSQMFAAL
jgi:hypothetical protein